MNVNQDISISVRNLFKVYKLYDNPKERLKESLSFSRRKFHKEFYALNNISFDVMKGEAVGIIGKNGSGKSTLLKIITGVLTPTSGEVIVKGKVAALLELGAGFNPEYTGMENIFLQGTLMGYTKKEMEAKVEEIIDFAEIGDFIHQPVKMYSSGMFVRLAFAVSTQVSPDILIVDEALAVGDEKFQRKCFSYLEKVRNNGTTILFVSHSMSTVEQLCTKGILLESGELIFNGEPKDAIDIYHERIYALDKEHLMNLNKKKKQESKKFENNHIEVTDNSSINDNTEIQASTSDNHNSEIQTTTIVNEDNKSNIVKITNVAMYDHNNEESYLYNTGSFSKIIITIENITDETIDDVIVGFKIRTKQGVEVYGTSTFYYENLDIILNPYSSVNVTFTQDLNLIQGTYFLSFAVAKRNVSDMGYFDKLVDSVVLQIEDKKSTGSGIANLFSNISISEV